MDTQDIKVYKRCPVCGEDYGSYMVDSVELETGIEAGRIYRDGYDYCYDEMCKSCEEASEQREFDEAHADDVAQATLDSINFDEEQELLGIWADLTS